MKQFKITYMYALPSWDEYNKTEYESYTLFTDNVEHAYQQFRKLACTAGKAPLKYWVGGADIKELKK